MRPPCASLLLAASLALAPSAHATMPEELRRLASTMLGNSPLVADDAPIWIALPKSPDPSAVRGRRGLELEASLAELADGRPVLLLGTPEFDVWRVFVPSAEPIEALDEWASRSRTQIEWASQRDSSRMARMPLKTAEGMPISDLYQMAFVFGRPEVSSASLLLAPPGNWQQYNFARESYLQINPPSPLADDATWARASAAGDEATCLYAGFRPDRLVSGLHGRLPSSGLLARLFAPDTWRDGFAVVRATDGHVTIEGSWTAGSRGELPIAASGDHPLLDLVSSETSLVVAVHHSGAQAVWDLATSMVLERDYEGRESALLHDERAFEERLGFSIRRSLLPLIGERVVVGAVRDRGRGSDRALRWSCIVETPDGPLLDDHVERAMTRLGASVTRTQRMGLALNIAAFPDRGPGAEFAWVAGDDWIAFARGSDNLLRFLRTPGSEAPSLRERFAAVDGWNESQAASPIVVCARGGILPDAIDRWLDGVALAFQPTADGVAVRGAAIVRDNSADVSRRDPFAAAAGI